MTRCIIVDDEQPARDLISLHLSALNDFTILKTFENALDAFEFLQNNKVDLLFLDIQMPKISGLKLIRLLKFPPRIILTTAFREHAVEAFELDVLDYLVKPVTQERFLMSISKFKSLQAPLPAPVPAEEFTDAYIFLKVAGKQTRIFLRDIVFIEGLKDFIKIHTKNRVYIASERLSYMEQRLPDRRFARIHKSYIVSLSNVAGYTPEQVTIADRLLPVGRVFRNEFLKRI